jgi:hypothetical protein
MITLTIAIIIILVIIFAMANKMMKIEEELNSQNLHFSKRIAVLWSRIDIDHQYRSKILQDLEVRLDTQTVKPEKPTKVTAKKRIEERRKKNRERARAYRAKQKAKAK